MLPRITKDFVDKIHNFIIDRFGGDYGELNPQLIKSALSAPYSSFAGQEIYDTDLKKCCRLFYGLVYNHGYADGNKRTGAIIFLWALDLCGIGSSKITNRFLSDTALLIAGGRLSVDQIIEAVETFLNNT